MNEMRSCQAQPWYGRVVTLRAFYFQLPLLALGAVPACGGSTTPQPADPTSASPAQPEPAASTTNDAATAPDGQAPHALAQCTSAQEPRVGLVFTCEAFRVILSKFSHDQAVSDDVLNKVEGDMLEGFKRGVKGDVKARRMSIDSPDGPLPYTAFGVFDGATQKGSGSLLAVKAPENQVLSVLCVAKGDMNGEVCTRVLGDIVQRGLPVSN